MLCDDSDIIELRSFGEAIDIPTFPSLTNNGDAATLESPDGTLIHEVIYEKSWYGDPDRDDGGYTLELINPNDPCLAASNWMASSSDVGGTPAAQNSNWMPSNPSEGVIAERVLSKSMNEVEVSFNRIPSSATSEMEFDISPAITIIDIVANDSDPRTLTLVLAEQLSSGTVYTLSVSGSISDCIGQSSGSVQLVDFVLPESFGVGELVINEILFNPIGGESDYVEIYNRSIKFIDLRQLIVGNLDSDGSGSSRTLPDSYVIGPQDFVVLTENRLALLARYPVAVDAKVLEVDLPSFNNTDGNVTLFLEENGTQVIIDAMDYDENMHNVFIDDPEGVALERVNVNSDSDDRMNWQSGAASSDYGSPTLPNTQRIATTISANNLVSLKRKTFFPQGQVDAQLQIVFEVERSDYIGTLDVYDSAGRAVRQLANNQLIGRNDLYQWDGRDQDGQLMNAGIYIILVQLVTADGELVTKKLPCVLSRSI